MTGGHAFREVFPWLEPMTPAWRVISLGRFPALVEDRSALGLLRITGSPLEFVVTRPVPGSNRAVWSPLPTSQPVYGASPAAFSRKNTRIGVRSSGARQFSTGLDIAARAFNAANAEPDGHSEDTDYNGR
jgi:hypothetical protein